MIVKNPTKNDGLPVLKILIESYRVLFLNHKIYLKLIWFPVLIGMAYNYINTAFAWATENLIWFIFLLCVYSICLVPPITSWHRMIINSSTEMCPRISYSYKSEEFKYALVGVQFFSAYLILSVVIVWLVSLTSLIDIVDIDLLSVVIPVVGLWPVSCLFMALPSAAIGHSAKFLDSIKLVKDNVFRLYILYLAALSPVFILQEVFDSISGWNPGTEESSLIIIRSLYFTIVEFLFFTITVGVLSLSYNWLIDKQR